MYLLDGGTRRSVYAKKQLPTKKILETNLGRKTLKNRHITLVDRKLNRASLLIRRRYNQLCICKNQLRTKKIIETNLERKTIKKIVTLHYCIKNSVLTRQRYKQLCICNTLLSTKNITKPNLGRKSHKKITLREKKEFITLYRSVENSL